MKLILLALCGVTLQAAEFTLKPEGGTVRVHTEISYEGRGERLIASAVNDGPSTLPTVRMCVQRVPNVCIFKIWNEESWKPGAKLEWSVFSPRHLPDLGLEVVLLVSDPVANREPKREAKVKLEPAINPGPVWEIGTVVHQQFGISPGGVYAAPLGSGAIAVPLSRRSNVVVVDSGPYRYTWSEVGQRHVVLIVGGQVRFLQEGSEFIVLDTKASRHRFRLVGQALLSALPPK